MRAAPPPLLAALLVAVGGGVAACDGGGAVVQPMPRVAWEGRVDGVSFGATQAEVRSTLGTPGGQTYDEVFGCLPIADLYVDGEEAGLAVHYTRAPSGSLVAAMFELGTSRYLELRRYSGRSAEGIGLGSTRREVERAFGPDPRGVSPAVYALGPSEAWFFYGAVRTASPADSVVSALILSAPFIDARRAGEPCRGAA